MILADQIDFAPIKKISASSAPTGSTHAFFTNLSEAVKSTYDVDVDFDLQKEFDRMKKFKGAHRGLYIENFMRVGRTYGFQTKDRKYRVMITHYSRVPKVFNVANYHLQQYGPLIAGIACFKGHDIEKAGKGGVIAEIPSYAERKAEKKVFLIRGHEHGAKLYKFQNSWSLDECISKMSYRTFLTSVRYLYCLQSILLVKQ
jgi:hypothetical protein